MRSFESGYLSALEAENLRPFYLFEVESLYLWSGHYSLSWDSKTWLGNGWFQGLSSIKEEGNRNASLEIALSGVTQTIMSLILVDLKQGSIGTLYYGLFDGSNSIIADPVVLFVGEYDQSRITDSVDESLVSISFNSELTRLNKKTDLRYTDAAQKNLFPTDQGLEYVAGLSEWKGYFGVPK